MGLNELYQKSLTDINSTVYLTAYDFVFVCRIDLVLKPKLLDVFTPFSQKIIFPTITWKKDDTVGQHPRVNDMMLFIPKKYFNLLSDIEISHKSWYLLANTYNISYDNIDVLIKTYHDSDSSKDYNPLYFIANRKESNVFHSPGYVFQKQHYGMQKK